MKSLTTVIIIALLILVGYLYFSKGTGNQVTDIKSKYDSVIRPHITRIAELKRHEDSLRHKLKADSTISKKEKVRYEKTIFNLKKELKAAKFTGNAATVPDDTVQLAMDCLEREPIRDSIDSVNYTRIAQLEQEKAQLVKDYESIMDDNQEQKNELQAIINLKDQQIGELIKQYKKANRKAKLRIIEGVGLGLIGGLAVGGLK